MVLPRRHPRIIVQSDMDFPQGGRGSSTRVDTDLQQIQVEISRNQKANFVRNTAEGSRKTLQGSFKISL